MASQPSSWSAPPSFDPSLEHLVSIRDTMAATEWEQALLSDENLRLLSAKPCSKSLDNRLVALTLNWGRYLTDLCDREYHEYDHKEMEAEKLYYRNMAISSHRFNNLDNLVSRLHANVENSSAGHQVACRTKKNRRTPHRCRYQSASAQARYAIMQLACNGFGAWLEAYNKGGWLLAVQARTHSFSFDEEISQLSWVDLEDGVCPSVARPRMRLYLVLGGYSWGDVSYKVPSPEEFERSIPDKVKHVYRWMDAIPWNTDASLVVVPDNFDSIYNFLESSDEEDEDGGSTASADVGSESNNK